MNSKSKVAVFWTFSSLLLLLLLFCRFENIFGFHVGLALWNSTNYVQLLFWVSTTFCLKKINKATIMH